MNLFPRLLIKGVKTRPVKKRGQHLFGVQSRRLDARPGPQHVLGRRESGSGYRMAIFRWRERSPTMKTIKQEEPVSRSRFINCPICKNHTMKLKRVTQVGRCKSCNESYKVVIVYVKSGKAGKPLTTSVSTKSAAGQQPMPEATLPSWQMPSDVSLFGSPGESYSGFSDSGLNYGKTEGDEKSQSSSEQ